jgi:hypothetical protein
MALARVVDVVVVSRSASISNRLNQAAQRRIFDAVACHQRVVLYRGQSAYGVSGMSVTSGTGGPMFTRPGCSSALPSSNEVGSPLCLHAA